MCLSSLIINERYKLIIHSYIGGDRSVGIATRYELDGPGI